MNLISQPDVAPLPPPPPTLDLEAEAEDRLRLRREQEGKRRGRESLIIDPAINTGEGSGLSLNR